MSNPEPLRRYRAQPDRAAELAAYGHQLARSKEWDDIEQFVAHAIHVAGVGPLDVAQRRFTEWANRARRHPDQWLGDDPAEAAAGAWLDAAVYLQSVLIALGAEPDDLPESRPEEKT